MAKKAQKVSAQTTEADPLHESVDRLAMEIRLLREVMDELREQYSWITRNGLPVQPVEHFVLKQMARNPCAKDWGKRLKVVRWTETPKSSAANDLDAISDFAQHFESIVHGIAEAQLEVLLVALDGVREQILAAIQKPSREARAQLPPNPLATSDGDPVTSASPPPSDAPEPGHLF